MGPSAPCAPDTVAFRNCTGTELLGGGSVRSQANLSGWGRHSAYELGVVLDDAGKDSEVHDVPGRLSSFGTFTRTSGQTGSKLTVRALPNLAVEVGAKGGRPMPTSGRESRSIE